MASETTDINAAETAGDWTDEANLVGAGDSSCSYTTTGGNTSGEYSFDFSSVTGTINGISLMVHGHGQEADDLVIELIDSTSTWRSKTTAVYGSNNVNCANAQDATVGGAADTWGGTWTAAWITSTSFRVRVSFEAAPGGSWIAADYIEVTVYYTAAAAGVIQPIVDDGTIQLITDDGTIQKIVD
jgi:hypothetical protein